MAVLNFPDDHNPGVSRLGNSQNYRNVSAQVGQAQGKQSFQRVITLGLLLGQARIR